MEILKIVKATDRIKIDRKPVAFEDLVKFINNGLAKGIHEFNLAKMIAINDTSALKLLKK